MYNKIIGTDYSYSDFIDEGDLIGQSHFQTITIEFSTNSGGNSIKEYYRVVGLILYESDIKAESAKGFIDIFFSKGAYKNLVKTLLSQNSILMNSSLLHNASAMYQVIVLRLRIDKLYKV